MRLEDQVCSLELAKRLKELGVKKESYFNWITLLPNEEKWFVSSMSPNHAPRKIRQYYSAFTVAELGAMLPFTIKMYEWKSLKWPEGKTWYLNSTIGYTDHGYSPTVAYNFYLYSDEEELDAVNMIVGEDFSDKNEANARAMMLVYLLENKLIDSPLRETTE